MGKRLEGLLQDPNVSEDAKMAALVLGRDFDKIGWVIRIETNQCAGILLRDEHGIYMPTELEKIDAIAILNSELRRSLSRTDPLITFEEQVEFA